MSRSLIIRHEAEADITGAAAWYEAEAYGLGEKFIRTVHSCILHAVRDPQHFRRVHPDVRRALVHGFPYSIYFIVDDEDVSVIACTHNRRRADEWKKRL